MTLLTICAALAKNVGMAIPDQIIANPAREWKEAVQFANETGEELSRRGDWGFLTATTTITGTGTQFAMPDAAERINGTVFAGTSILRALTRAEWNTLPAVSGVPRYFLLELPNISFWPALAASSVDVTYQSDKWAVTGGLPANGFMADDDTVLFDEALFVKGLVVRWRRQKNMDYADNEAEYEAALQDYARFDDKNRL